MSAEISIDKKKVGDFLAEGKVRQYLIPEYQRPYAWGDDQVIALFEDLWDFAQTKGGYDHESETYFLGSIVSFENKDLGVAEIIDGQQRLTSLCLLLRAIYARLEGDDAKSAKRLRGQIEPALWKVDPRTGDVDYSRPLFRSAVISDDGNKIIQNILTTGQTDGSAKDNYSKNYRKFQMLIDGAIKKAPLTFFHSFVFAVLNQAIVLPITASSQDAALTIFSTLNNRGLPLSDADIFKAKIYNRLQLAGNQAKTDRFIADWKLMEARAEEAGETVQSLFYYDMFFERAREKDQRTTTPGLRNYFQDKGGIRLADDVLMSRLADILALFEFINKGIVADGEEWMEDLGISRSFDILSSYPNEFWKYPVIVFYLQYRGREDFVSVFDAFLKHLLGMLLCRYLEMPTISAVKGDILKLNAAIIDTCKPAFPQERIEREELRPRIVEPHAKLVRMLLKLQAYGHQQPLLPRTWDIEHILPQKWENGYFPTGVTDDFVRTRVEHIGNKVPFEKVKNIKASNGFFETKKGQYETSAIDVVRGLCDYPSWGLDQIAQRDARVSDEILAALSSLTSK